MDTRDRIRHDRSRYERPTLGWRCGRAALWGTPCRRGPTAFGGCGGVAACTPAKSGDAWQCRRPPADGGPCTPGPDGQGQCGLRQPPCAPRPTLAVWRKRAAMLSVLVSVALIALFAGAARMAPVPVSSLDPGPLSGAHAHFIGQDNCGACHEAHGKGATTWWRTAAAGFTAPATDTKLAQACTDCHGFNGMEKVAHNQSFPERGDILQTDCLMCHTEHKGTMAPVSTIADAQCQTCHTQHIDDFATNHPAFPPGFPHDHAKGIRFNHATHLSKHFQDAQLANLVPEGGCTGCHEIATAARNIQPAGFDATCAGCHATAIASRELVLFRWPEIESSALQAADIAEACGLDETQAAELAEQLDESQFSAISVDIPTALQALLTDSSADDIGEFGPAAQDIAESAIIDGADPLVALSEERFGEAAGKRLFAGLNGEQVRRAFCAWAANQEYEPTGTAELSGWKADYLDIRYVRAGHADPVLKAWIEALAALPTPEDADAADRLTAARSELLAPDGPGACMKCHATTEQENGSVQVAWSHTLGEARALTTFDHKPHVNLLGPQKSCTNCHALDATAGGDANSAFKAVSVAGCAECHAAGKLRDDCLMCHVYHQDHALKKGMMADAE